MVVSFVYRLTLFAAIVALANRDCRASLIVAQGWDLQQTSSATFGGFAFQGVALGTYNFGGSIGSQSTGTADTIVQRTQTATGPGSPMIATTMSALQLQSTVPINFEGNGLDTYYITLQSAAARAAPARTQLRLAPKATRTARTTLR